MNFRGLILALIVCGIIGAFIGGAFYKSHSLKAEITEITKGTVLTFPTMEKLLAWQGIFPKTVIHEDVKRKLRNKDIKGVNDVCAKCH